jgi:hypothetical protein
MDEIEVSFRKCELFSKEEIIQSLEMTMSYYRDSKDISYTQLMRNAVLRIWALFFEKVKKAKLPILTERWKYYVYEYLGDSIVLNLCEGSDVQIDEDGFVSSISVQSDRPIIKVDCPYISIDEYATMQEVKSNTVVQWLKRGKLKYARFQNDEWHIPLLEERPSRGFDMTQYTLVADQPYEMDEFPLVSLCNSISLFHDTKSKEYTCRFDNYQTDFHERMEVSKEEIEYLEYAIIKSGKFRPGPRGGFVPLLPKAYEDE